MTSGRAPATGRRSDAFDGDVDARADRRSGVAHVALADGRARDARRRPRRAPPLQPGAHGRSRSTSAALRIADAGDVAEPDGPEGEAAVRDPRRDARPRAPTRGRARRRQQRDLRRSRRAPARAGLITLDAHFDLRDGVSNGSPVRRLIEDGLDPRRIVQIGIADFANSVAYARRAADYGITVIGLDDVRRRGAADVMARGARGRRGGRRRHPSRHRRRRLRPLGRARVPGVSVPGGLAAWELRALVRGRGIRCPARVAPTSSRWMPRPTRPTSARCGSPRCACSNCSQDWGYAHDPTRSGAPREVRLGRPEPRRPRPAARTIAACATRRAWRARSPRPASAPR